MFTSATLLKKHLSHVFFKDFDDRFKRTTFQSTTQRLPPKRDMKHQFTILENRFLHMKK